MNVNQGQLAEILSVTPQTLGAWQVEGLPIQQKGELGKENVYDVRAVIDWMIERAVQKVRAQSPRDRQLELQNKLLELDLAEREKRLVPADQVGPVWRQRVLSAAAFLSGAPSRLAGILEGTPGVEGKRKALRETFNEFLTKLGTNGARMQDELDALLAELPAERVRAFHERLAPPPPKESA